MPLIPSTVRQTRSMAPIASLGLRPNHHMPQRSAASPSKCAIGRRALAKSRFDRRLDNGATTRSSVAASASSSSSASASPSSSGAGSPPRKPVSIRLPICPGDQADQAAAACVSAWRENKARKLPTRLLVTLSLPLVGATDLDDWPGGIRQQFKAAKPLVERMLEEIRRQAGGGEFFREAPRSSLWDDADAVCAFDSPKLACVVFPTPETLKQLDALAAGKDGVEGGLTIIVNPQWSLTKGSQLISDFGIGPWRAANEAKAASFERAFCLKSVRIRGDEARVWYSRAAEVDFEAGRAAAGAAEAGERSGGGRSEGEGGREGGERGGAGSSSSSSTRPRGPWNVFLVTAAGSTTSSSRLIASGDAEPSYPELEALLKSKGNVASRGWLERAQSKAKFLKDSL